MTTAPAPSAARFQLHFAEFVALVAFMMGLTALGIDTLLPAFPMIAAEFHVATENDLQLLVYVYMIGFAVTQLAYGPVSDMVGRRPVMIVGMLLFAVGGVAAMLAHSFTALIAARLVQGMGAAAARVLAVSIVRDRFSGRDMARVMSLTMMVFITIPVLAPAFGSLVLLFGGWRFLFGVMFALVLAVLAWFTLRMPETLHPEYRMPLSWRRIEEGVLACVRNRAAAGYSTAMGLMSGCLMGYVGSAQQIFGADVYALGAWFPLAFGLVACVMGVGAFVNSRLVARHGMRRMAHTALVGYVAVALLQLAVSFAYGGHPPLVVFGLILAANNFLFSLTVPNFNAMSMEPLGAIAGTASSLIGFYTTLMGALLGLAIGQAFDGTVLPLGAGFVVYSVLSLAVVLWAEKGRLFQAQHAAPRH
ncbi:multidrug effflux MFS transporter [Oharaeibacter diazotrophicus]|uniref:DHA1 family bicyclomycin/chloramphenicol resistance-like MFS transporter n=1 Tax=Oharaeibacter diazotrophicus TaxID=1920512 RepID=A0A4R6RAS2_9HYPH|nr:multidrug effflux MFS transporter [Oharaeibacter diazotrophicus]TDP82737.1 DHA1 family bicyclomycin/chloramphenicol resistance-like MFS transporter [Oharaeibacter diazotrophicus]BBE72501.1 bicyclomycin resistance protein [Pleomorphomonas sp. SM30]GLS76532.1 Bcr/CflA family drug resistance efflux transporter [Oharaeibacter diazotrophicus]